MMATLQGLEPRSTVLETAILPLNYRVTDAGYKIRRHRFDVAAQILALFYWSRFVSRVPVVPTKAGFPGFHCKPKWVQL